jgi:hypothetical protein
MQSNLQTPDTNKTSAGNTCYAMGPLKVHIHLDDWTEIIIDCRCCAVPGNQSEQPRGAESTGTRTLAGNRCDLGGINDGACRSVKHRRRDAKTNPREILIIADTSTPPGCVCFKHLLSAQTFAAGTYVPVQGGISLCPMKYINNPSA